MAKDRARPDDDNPQWTKNDLALARPASQVVGEAASKALVRKGGRPTKPADERKQQVTIRLSPDVLAALRASGPGWQARADRALRAAFVDPVSPGVLDVMTLAALAKEQGRTIARVPRDDDLRYVRRSEDGTFGETDKRPRSSGSSGVSDTQSRSAGGKIDRGERATGEGRVDSEPKRA